MVLVFHCCGHLEAVSQLVSIFVSNRFLVSLMTIPSQSEAMTLIRAMELIGSEFVEERGKQRRREIMS